MMMKYFKLAFILFILGIALIIINALVYEGAFSVVLFIPVFYGKGILAVIGALLIVLSLLVAMFGFAKEFVYEKEEEVTVLAPPCREEKKMKAGGIVLLGPIPIVFSTEKSLVAILLAVAIVIIVVTLVIFLLMLH
ncbi:MAG: DUF131 domain-containing protein [Candidatus Thermoplasmatota archaeon]